MLGFLEFNEIDEAAKTPAQKMDFKRMMSGAMSRKEYNEKYPKKVDPTKKLDKTGVYKNLIKTNEEADLEEEKKDDVPFDPPYSDVKADEPAKGTKGIHTAMSRARHLARLALQNVQKKKNVKEECDACSVCGQTPCNCTSISEDASPMIKPPTNRFDNKKEAFAHAKQHGGKVYRREYINPRTGIKDTHFVVKEDLDEAIDKKADLRAALAKHEQHAIDANKRGDDEAVKTHQGYINKIKTKMAKLARSE